MNSIADYKVSVIVPIYNVERYLSVCIDSILDQTYKNIEIILVDDGSTDRSGIICDEYLKKDKRIKVIHNVNGGVSDARNCGIAHSLGEYIAFIDSDDYVDKRYIENLMVGISDYNADAAISDFIRVTDNKNSTKDSLVKYKEMSNTECLKYCYCGGFSGINVTPWGKIFKRSVYINNNINYPKGKIHEDMYTTYKLMYYSLKIVYADCKSYYYRMRDDSIMHENFSAKNMVALDGTAGAINFYENIGEGELKILAINFHMRLMFVMIYKLRHSDEPEEIIQYYSDRMRIDSDKYLTKGNLKGHRRLLYRFIVKHPYDFLLKKVGV